MKLELKHLASYLPYGLKIKTKHGIDTMEVLEDCIINSTCEQSYGYNDCKPEFKPILRPLSDLTKEIAGVVHISKVGHILEPKGSTVEIDGVYDFGWDNHVCDDYQGYSIGWRNDDCWFGLYFDYYDFYNQDDSFTGDMINFNIEAFEYLFQHHFDVYGLIEQGLAIDINTIK